MRSDRQHWLGALMCGFLLLTGISCSKTSTKYKPVEYNLYAAVWEDGGDRGEIFIVDTEIDSLIDSVYYPGSVGVVIGSPDGKYVAGLSGDTCVRIYDAHDLTFVGELACRVHPVFIPTDNLILGFTRLTVKFFDYHTFQLLDEDSIGVYWPQLSPDGKVIYGLVYFGEGRIDSTGFIIYDYRQRTTTRLWTRLSRPDGGKYRIFRYHVHPDGNRVYGLSGNHIFCYDLNGDSAVFENPIYAPYGGIRVSPDGREVYFTDPGPPIGNDTPGKIYIHDGDNGILLDEISLLDLDTSGVYPRPLYGFDIRFHPTKPKVYVSTWGQKALGPILVIDTEKREIIKWFLPHFDHMPQGIDIGPKL